MDIAAMSTILSQAKVMQQVNISVIKMAMDSAQNSNQMLQDLAETNTKIMEMSVSPHVGGNLDIKL